MFKVILQNKMQKYFVIYAACLAMVACSQERMDTVINDETEEAVMVPVKVHVDGFSVSMEDFDAQAPRRAAEKVEGYSGVNAVTLAFYQQDDNTKVYKVTQSKAEKTAFGDFSLALPMGKYTMVVLAYYTSDGNPMVLTSPTEAAFTGAHSFETFATTKAVSITNNTPVDISAQLERIATQLQVKSVDGKTENVKNVRMTFSAGSKSFNPTTGLALSDTGYENTIGNSTTVGGLSTSRGYLFLTSDEQTMDVTIETLDVDGHVLFSKQVKNVPFKRNRTTVLTGYLYSNPSISGTFKVNADWLEEYEMEL